MLQEASADPNRVKVIKFLSWLAVDIRIKDERERVIEASA
jgi:hypothetical protein